MLPDLFELNFHILLGTFLVFLILIWRDISLVDHHNYLWINKRRTILVALWWALLSPFLSRGTTILTWVTMGMNVLMIVVFVMRPCQEEEVEASFRRIGRN